MKCKEKERQNRDKEEIQTSVARSCDMLQSATLGIVILGTECKAYMSNWQH